MINRRKFLGGLVASFAAQSVVGRAADATDVPLLRLGIVSDSHCMTAHDPSDKKTWGHFSTYTLQGALEKFRAWGVDAVVHPGDFTEYGALKELAATGTVWQRVFPGDAGADGKKVEKLFVRGNHDKMKGNGAPPEALIKTDPAKAWKDCLGIDWYTEKVMIRTVKGYTFVLADWDATDKDVDAFLAAHEQDLPKDKPFFYVQHAAVRGTVWPQDSFAKPGYPCKSGLVKFPNCIALTGHSHASITLGDQTWQGAFTAIGCGCLQYMDNRRGRDNSWRVKVGHAKRCDATGRQGMYMRVYADRIVVERWDFMRHEKVGPDHVFPLDGSKPYAYEEQRKRARAPKFPAGAALSFAEKDGRCRTSSGNVPERQLWVTVPRAAECAYDEGRVYEYECRVFAEGAAEPLVVRRELAAGYFLNDARVEKATVVAFGLDELPKDKTLRFEVRAMDCWENRSEPLVGETKVVAG